MRALLLDVGNSRLKWGLSEDGEIRRTGHVTQSSLRENGFGVLTKRLPRKFDTVLVSNVAGATFATRLSGLLSAHCDCDVHFARPARRGYGVVNSYRSPRRMGTDRWVALVGARAEFGRACLVVDAGTAMTIDAMDDDGLHLGGQILPGVRLMAAALSRETAEIPQGGTRVPDASPGAGMFSNDTSGAVRQGAWNALIGAIERAFAAVADAGHDPVLALTGGDAARMLDALGDKALHRPHLVLGGLNHMLRAHR